MAGTRRRRIPYRPVCGGLAHVSQPKGKRGTAVMRAAAAMESHGEYLGTEATDLPYVL